MLNTSLLLIAFIGQLSWSDYKGVPDSAQMAQGYAANTVYEWNMETTTDEYGRCFFSVTCNFVPEKSWTTTENPWTLRHEQTHLRIAQLFCNKLMKRLEKYQGCKESQRKKADDLYNQYWNKSRQINDLFDKETEHSKRTEIERTWEYNIMLETKNPAKRPDCSY